MSQSNFRLPLDRAELLLGKIVDDLRPVCECIEIAGGVRRKRPDVGDLEVIVIPKFSQSLLADVPGVSLLDMHLVTLCNQGRLMRASAAPITELTTKSFYIPHLMREGHFFKLEIYTSDADRWPVELAIRTGSADFSHRLVTWHKYGGFLPGHWRIADGWQVYELDGTGGERRLFFESERQFIEAVCGQWVPPEKRG